LRELKSAPWDEMDLIFLLNPIHPKSKKILIWTANKAKIASHGLFHKKYFVPKKIHVSSSYR
jgi:hypothetical protein